MGSRLPSIKCCCRIRAVTSHKGRNRFQSTFEPRYLRSGKRWRIRVYGGWIGNWDRTFEWQSRILLLTLCKGQIDIQSFYKISQSLIMGQYSEHCISAMVQDRRFVSKDSLWEVDCPLSNAAVGSQLWRHISVETTASQLSNRFISETVTARQSVSKEHK
jgi:hypothetical protein